jgi:hypothetical protein
MRNVQVKHWYVQHLPHTGSIACGQPAARVQDLWNDADVLHHLHAARPQHTPRHALMAIVQALAAGNPEVHQRWCTHDAQLWVCVQLLLQCIHACLVDGWHPHLQAPQVVQWLNGLT